MTNPMKPNPSANGNGFLPDNYEVPQASGDYMKLQKGENRFRILSKPIVGWLDWKDKKPLHFAIDKKPLAPVDPKQPIKHFWALVVYNVIEERIQILEITQKTIQAAIQQLSKDADWGNPFTYDIKVMKTGDGMETEYATTPVPHKPAGEEIKKAYFDKQPINLDALWTGGDPFAGAAQPVQEVQKPVESIPYVALPGEGVDESENLSF